MTESEFLKGPDFMKLGRAIQSENWQLAAMTLRRLRQNAADAGITVFDRQFMGLGQCVNARQKTEAQNCLALVTAKRVSLLNQSGRQEHATQQQH